MKTLIVYASQYGATREIAQRIADRISGAVVHDLKQSKLQSVDAFDCVIIGSPLYVGSIRKEVKAFLTGNIEFLRGKSLGLFLSGLEPENEQMCFEKNFPPDILSASKAKCFTGGRYDPAKAGRFHKLLLRIVGKPTSNLDTIDDEVIEQFAEAMRI